MTLYEFIDKVGKAAQSYYPKYQILPSLCIAQALLESNKSDYTKGLLTLSGLATDCHNYFGMKWSKGCGCDYKEYSTKEQKSTGQYYTVVSKFRKYPTFEAGIKGYFDFLQYQRFKNLKGVTDYRIACNLIRQDGWATSLTYTQNLVKRIEFLQLYNYDAAVKGTAVKASPFSVGKTYTLQSDLYVRKEPDGDYQNPNDMTESGRKQSVIIESRAYLKKNTRVTCKDIYEVNGSWWVKIPSGWICGMSKAGKLYIK